MAGFLTNSGLAKLAVATPLTPMTVKYMAFDGGQGTPRPTMTKLFNEVYRTEIPNPTKDADAPTNLVFSGFVPTTVGGWTVYGVGLFDSSDVLVAYLELAEPVVKSAPDSALKMSWQQDFIISLANAGQTNLIVTDSVQFRHDALTNRNHPDAHDIASITGLQTELDKDKNNVKITGDQVVGGVKTFSEVVKLDQITNGVGTVDFETTGASFTARYDRKYVGVALDPENSQVGFIGQMVGDPSGLNPATPKSAGVVKIGDNIEVRDGLIRVPTAGVGPHGVVAPGLNVTIDREGYVDVEVGSKTERGVLSVGDNINVSATGEISVPLANASVSGVTKLVNVLSSTGTTVALTAAMGKQLNDQAFGVGQTPVNMTSARSVGVDYTNTSSRPIQVSVTLRASGQNRFMELRVNNIVFGAANNTEQHDKASTLTTMVLPGNTYRVNGTFSEWSEIR